MQMGYIHSDGGDGLKWGENGVETNDKRGLDVVLGKQCWQFDPWPTRGDPETPLSACSCSPAPPILNDQGALPVSDISGGRCFPSSREEQG